MSKTAQVRARTEPELKRSAEAILSRLGISPTAAINMFYSQIVHQQGLPFSPVLPNDETRRAIDDAREGRDLIEAGSLEDLLSALDDE